MANHIFNRGELHAPAVASREGPETIHYKLHPIPHEPGSKSKQQTAARIIEKEPIPAGTLEKIVAERNPTLQRDLVHHVLQATVHAMLDELQQGHRVTINNFLSIGLSLKGTVDPKKPLDAKRLTLTPTARFSQNFITALNRGAQLAYDPE